MQQDHDRSSNDAIPATAMQWVGNHTTAALVDTMEETAMTAYDDVRFVSRTDGSVVFSQQNMICEPARGVWANSGETVIARVNRRSSPGRWMASIGQQTAYLPAQTLHEACGLMVRRLEGVVTTAH